MEIKHKVVLRHKTGLYFGHNTQLTRQLWHAWTWYPGEPFEVWLKHSIYAPQNADEYEAFEVEMSIKLLAKEVSDEQQSEIVPENGRSDEGGGAAC